jgi:hypothetical protein
LVAQYNGHVRAGRWGQALATAEHAVVRLEATDDPARLGWYSLLPDLRRMALYEVILPAGMGL